MAEQTVIISLHTQTYGFTQGKVQTGAVKRDKQRLHGQSASSRYLVGLLEAVPRIRGGVHPSPRVSIGLHVRSLFIAML